MTSRVVIVEDDFLVVTYLSDCCEAYGFEVVGNARNADAAITAIREAEPDIILMDLRLLGQGDGVDVARTVGGDLPDHRIIFITGSSEPSSIDRIRSVDPFKILIKPVYPQDLQDALTEAAASLAS